MTGGEGELGHELLVEVLAVVQAGQGVLGRRDVHLLGEAQLGSVRERELDDAGPAELDLVAVAQQTAVDAVVLDERAVRALQILEPHLARHLDHDPRMLARDPRVLDLDLARLSAAHVGDGAVEAVVLADVVAGNDDQVRVRPVPAGAAAGPPRQLVEVRDDRGVLGRPVVVLRRLLVEAGSATADAAHPRPASLVLPSGAHSRDPRSRRSRHRRRPPPPACPTTTPRRSGCDRLTSPDTRAGPPRQPVPARSGRRRPAPSPLRC